MYDLKVDKPTAVRRADGKWDVTVPIEAKKISVEGHGGEKEAALNGRIEVGLFTAERGRDAFDSSHVILMERHPIRSARQVLKFVSDRKPSYAGVDPYNFYIDRNSADKCGRGNELRRYVRLAYSIGRSTLNVLPCPGSLVTVIEPPNSSASMRDAESPSPVPPRPFELASCVNG